MQSARQNPTMLSTMKSKITGILTGALGVLFWIAVWQVAAMVLSKPYILPDVPKTLSALGKIIVSDGFITIVLSTIVRVLLGLASGVVLGVLLAFLTNRFPFLNTFVTPIMSVIKSTPVASFIIILWILMNGSLLSIFVAFLMVMPIVWQNISDGFSAIDKELSEVCDAFGFSYKKRLKLLILPTLSAYLFPALITSVGLAWKSEIAAEIIAYTKSSIGAMINDAKFNFETDKVFAWTIIVVIFSLILEFLTKFLIRRSKK